MATSNPTLSQLKVRMARQLPRASSFAGMVYRSSTPRYATESDLLSGAGSKQHGGRWNPVGIALVFASLTPETAMAETLAHYRYYGIPVEEAMPRTFVGIAVRLHAVLDLREGFVRRNLRVSLDRMLTWVGEKKSRRVKSQSLNSWGDLVQKSDWKG